MNKTPQVVFVTGAARSGTHLIGSLIREGLPCLYTGEINSFWRNQFPRLRHDMIPPSLADSKIVDRFHAAFPCEDDQEFIIDKTACNSLRLPFLYRLFPNAAFVHVIRDGRDVALSARRKFAGDMRKVTKFREPSTEQPDHTRLLTRLGRLRQFMSLNSFSRAIKEPKRAWAAVLRAFGFASTSPWGPSVPGLTELLRSHTLLQVAAYQWSVSVSMALAFPRMYPEARYLELRYEALTENPQQHIDHIGQLLGEKYDPNGILERVKVLAGGDTWQELMTPEEILEVEAVAGHMLAALGYK